MSQCWNVDIHMYMFLTCTNQMAVVMTVTIDLLLHVRRCQYVLLLDVRYICYGDLIEVGMLLEDKCSYRLAIIMIFSPLIIQFLNSHKKKLLFSNKHQLFLNTILWIAW